MTRRACAIYTRKSSDEGLEQEFNSLDAQREACEAYIKSQRHEGWVCLSERYDDGGLSGGTMERPALQRLLADIVRGRVRIVVVYKVDRLTRSLSDFTKIVDVLDENGASFVSVTQQFNTTTSMGRLTLNMLLSFAQFEREIAGERIRDKIKASKAKGMWMGGTVPLGYDAIDKQLVVNAVEADTVCRIFELYLELGSVRRLQEELAALGIVSKRHTHSTGRMTGGKPFQRGALYHLLSNRIYIGEIAHRGEVHQGRHDAIIEPATWDAAQALLASNRHERGLRTNAKAPSLLSGLVFDTEGQPLTPTHANKGGRRYRYYVSAALVRGTKDAASSGMRIPAGQLEGLVTDRLVRFLNSTMELADALAPFRLPARALDIAFERASKIAGQFDSDRRTRADTFRHLVTRIVVAPDELTIQLDRKPVALMLRLPGDAQDTTLDPVVLKVRASLQRAGQSKRLVIGGQREPRIDAGLVALFQEAFQARQLVLEVSKESMNQMTQRLGMPNGHLTTLMRISYLAPEIIRDILDGNQPPSLTRQKLLEKSRGLPLEWPEQRAWLGWES